MAMLDVVSWPPTGGSVAQVRRLGPEVGSHLTLFCICHMNQVNSRNDSLSHDVSTINIVVVLLLLLL